MKFGFLIVIASVSIASASVTITDTVVQDRVSFKIATPSATYIFDKKGGGFIGIIDVQGNDWISY